MEARSRILISTVMARVSSSSIIDDFDRSGLIRRILSQVAQSGRSTPGSTTSGGTMTRLNGIQSHEFDPVTAHLVAPKIPDGHDCILDTSDGFTLIFRADIESCKIYRALLYSFHTS
jgi:hypothetical protein